MIRRCGGMLVLWGWVVHPVCWGPVKLLIATTKKNTNTKGVWGVGLNVMGLVRWDVTGAGEVEESGADSFDGFNNQADFGNIVGGVFEGGDGGVEDSGTWGWEGLDVWEERSKEVGDVGAYDGVGGDNGVWLAAFEDGKEASGATGGLLLEGSKVGLVKGVEKKGGKGGGRGGWCGRDRRSRPDG
ncbi:hypothetical protein BC829DRAFT_420981 [Chytridium lagenaria]|nr:hypothetical protein BC829DRAFT_420981 [Chytridium lagenaria]